MITPEPLPCSCWLCTSMVTTLGWIRAAAPLIVPSTLAAAGAVWLVCGRLLTTVVLPLSSSAATVPAPTPPPTTAATTAAMMIARDRPDRGWSLPPGSGGSLGGGGPNPGYVVAGGGAYVQVAPLGCSLPG